MTKDWMKGWMMIFASSFVICLLSFSEASAQSIPDMKFRHLDTRDGLSNSQINCILRDSRGFMWFGTPYGLNRYDGYRFKTFLSYARDTTTLRSNRIDEVFEDVKRAVEELL